MRISVGLNSTYGVTNALQTARLRSVTILLIACCPCGGIAIAAPGDSGNDALTGNTNNYDVFVEDAVLYDSNVFRLPSSITDIATLVAPNATRQDYTDTLSLGGDGQWTYGAQVFQLRLRGDENRYLHNGELDNFATNDGLLWNWSVGSYLSGQLGADYYQSLVSYGETLYYGRDLLHATDYYASARYEFGPHWSLLAGVRDSNSSHTLEVAQVNDLHVKTANVGVQYALGAENTVGVEYDYADGNFPLGYELDNVLFDRSYTEDRGRVLLHYVLSQKTLFDLSAGYVNRSYKAEAIGQFSGYTWRAAMQWEPTEKTQLLVSGSRDLQSYLSAESDYFVSTSGSISPVWIPTEKLRLSVAAIYENQQYTALSISELIYGPRHDKIKTEQASLIYQPLKSLTIKSSFNDVQRASNQPLIPYDDKQVRIDVNFTL